MIADDRADEVLAGFDPYTVDVNANGAIRVFQVAGDRSGAEIDPFADEAVPNKPIGLLVAIALKDRGLDFAAHLADRADGDATAQDRTRADDAARADVGRAHDGVGLDFGGGVDVNRALFGISFCAPGAMTAPGR